MRDSTMQGRFSVADGGVTGQGPQGGGAQSGPGSQPAMKQGPEFRNPKELDSANTLDESGRRFFPRASR